MGQVTGEQSKMEGILEVLEDLEKQAGHLESVFTVAEPRHSVGIQGKDSIPWGW